MDVQQPEDNALTVRYVRIYWEDSTFTTVEIYVVGIKDVVLPYGINRTLFDLLSDFVGAFAIFCIKDRRLEVFSERSTELFGRTVRFIVESDIVGLTWE